MKHLKGIIYYMSPYSPDLQNQQKSQLFLVFNDQENRSFRDRVAQYIIKWLRGEANSLQIGTYYAYIFILFIVQGLTLSSKSVCKPFDHRVYC